MLYAEFNTGRFSEGRVDSELSPADWSWGWPCFKSLEEQGESPRLEDRRNGHLLASWLLGGGWGTFQREYGTCICPFFLQNIFPVWDVGAGSVFFHAKVKKRTKQKPPQPYFCDNLSCPGVWVFFVIPDKIGDGWGKFSLSCPLLNSRGKTRADCLIQDKYL